MRTMKVAIIGAGMMGRYHAQALRRIPMVEIVGLADPSEEFADKVCKELGIAHVYTDYLEMLDKEKPDVVHNCTPNHLHYEINKEIISRGIHVFCEKPLAMNSEESEALVHLAKEKGVFAGVNFNYRQNAIVRDMNERIRGIVSENDQKVWGKTFLIHGHYVQDWMQFDSDFNWRCLSEFGGVSRTVADIGSHWFDTVQYITGKKITRVYAKMTNVIPKRKKFSQSTTFSNEQKSHNYELMDIDTEDMAFVMFEMEDGVQGSAVFSQVSGGRKNDMSINFDGSQYAMTWNQENPDKLIIRDREKGTTMKYAGPEMLHGDAKRYASLPSGHPVGWADALMNGIYEYYRTICEDAPINYATFEDGNNIVKIVEACVRSNKENTWIEVNSCKMK